MKLAEALKIAEEVQGWLAPYCEPNRCEICGSIRRRKAEVGDVELLCVPNPLRATFGYRIMNGVDQKLDELLQEGALDCRRTQNGQTVYGIKNKLLVHVASGFPVDIFSTTETNWWMSLVIRTGPKESNIKLAMAAKQKSWKLNAYGSGYTCYDLCTGEEQGHVTCHSEREVFESVGLDYKEPWER